MRDYAKITPTFWTGKTGREIRRRGSEGVVVALYLLSSPHSNMLGLFYQPKLYMAHETGLGIEGASKGLQWCIEAGFCSFDDASEMVWVHEMAAYQIGEALSSADKRCKGIQKDYEALPECPFLGPFFDRYSQAFNLSSRRDFDPTDPSDETRGIASPFEAPSKPGTGTGTGTGVPPKPPQAPSKLHAELKSDDLEAEGVNPKHAADWLRVRRAKKAPLTRTAWDGVKRDAASAGLSPADAVRIAAENGWQGFKAAWLTNTGQAAAGKGSDAFAGAA